MGNSSSPCADCVFKEIESVEIGCLSGSNDSYQIDNVVPNPSNHNEVLTMISKLSDENINSKILYRYNMNKNTLFPVVYNNKKFSPLESIIEIFCQRYCKDFGSTTVLNADCVTVASNESFNLLPNAAIKDSIIIFGDFCKKLYNNQNLDQCPFLCNVYCTLNTKQWKFTKVHFFKGQTNLNSNSIDNNVTRLVQNIPNYQLRNGSDKNDSERTFLPLKRHGMKGVRCYEKFVFGVSGNQLYFWNFGNSESNDSTNNTNDCLSIKYIGKMRFTSQTRRFPHMMCIIPYSHYSLSINAIATLIKIIKLGTRVPDVSFIDSIDVANIKFDKKFEEIISYSQLTKEEIYQNFGFNLSQNKKFYKKMIQNNYRKFQCEYITIHKSRYLLVVRYLVQKNLMVFGDKNELMSQYH